MRYKNICRAAASIKRLLHQAGFAVNRCIGNLSSRRRTLSRLSCLALFSPICFANNIALIIDDIGNKPTDIRAFNLPNEVTFSILPHTPYSSEFAQLAEQQQREVMLHIPMEALSGKALGPGALMSNMHPQTIKAHLEAAHASVPNAIAVNNHMGSKLTQLTLPMNATMEYLQQEGLYFVDSRTTRYSKAQKIAEIHGVPSLHRHVFLDHVPEPKHISYQLKRLYRLAKKHGQAIGIAHPYNETLAYLEENLPTLQAKGIRLVPLSDLMQPAENQIARNDNSE